MPARSAMAYRTMRFAVLRKLIPMNVQMARLTIDWKSLELYDFCTVDNGFFVAVRALHGQVFTNQRKFRAGVVEWRSFPVDCWMTLRTTVLDHLILELTFMKVLVARFTTEIGKMEHLIFGSCAFVTVVARGCKMRSAQYKSGLSMTLNRKWRRFESFHSVALCAIVCIVLCELPLMKVGVTICAALKRQ
jgi:hypothetical protein